MRNIKLCLSVFLLMFLFSADKVQAKQFFPDSQNLNPEAEWISGNSSFKVAGVYWLPDYYKENAGFGRSETDSPVPVAPDISHPCETYGMEKPGKRDMTLYVCDIKYPAGHAGDECYDNCRCQDKYHFQDSTAVPRTDQCLSSEGKMGEGRNCEGKYTGCKCQPTKNPGTGEECALRCTFDNSCVKTKCKPSVTDFNTGETCVERCASNSSVCTKKGCKPAVYPGTGEECVEYCASNPSVCTRKQCKSGVTPGRGEECKERCASNSSICTKKGCKPGVSLSNDNDECTERCASDSSICTGKTCNSSCAEGSTTCSGSSTGGDGCGNTCRKCCTDSCPDYTLSYSSALRCAGGNYESCYDTCGGSTWYKCAAAADSCAGVTCSGANQECKNGSCVCKSGYKSCSGACQKCCSDSDCSGTNVCNNGVCGAAGADTCTVGNLQITCTGNTPKKVKVGTSTKGNPCYQCQSESSGDACKDYPSTSCNKYETVATCPTDASKKKCTPTCLSVINLKGAITELDGQRVVKQPSQSNRIIVLQDGKVSSVPNVIITSVKEYLNNMGISTNLCPTTRPTLTINNGGTPSYMRDVNIVSNGNLTGSISMENGTIKLGSSARITGTSVYLSGTSSISGGMDSNSSPTIDITSSLSSASSGNVSINVPSIRMNGSSYSTFYGPITVKWLKLDNKAKLYMYKNLTASNQGTYDNVQKGTGTNYGSSIVVFNGAVLAAKSGATIKAPRMYAGYFGVIQAAGGTINSTYDLWLGSYINGRTDSVGLAGASSGGTFKTPEVSMGHNSCLCLSANATFSSTADKGRYYDMRFGEARGFKAGTDDGKYKWVTHKDQDKFNDTSDKCKRYETEWHKLSCDYVCASWCKSKALNI